MVVVTNREWYRVGRPMLLPLESTYPLFDRKLPASFIGSTNFKRYQCTCQVEIICRRCVCIFAVKTLIIIQKTHDGGGRYRNWYYQYNGFCVLLSALRPMAISGLLTDWVLQFQLQVLRSLVCRSAFFFQEGEKTQEIAFLNNFYHILTGEFSSG